MKSLSSSLMNKKTFASILAILSIVGYGAFVFAVGPFAPGTELDPACSPYINNDPLQGVDPDCGVIQAWEQDIVNNLVFNNTTSIGIGVDAANFGLSFLDPSVHSVHINGELLMTTKDSLDNVLIYKRGDISSIFGPNAFGFFQGGDFDTQSQFFEFLNYDTVGGDQSYMVGFFDSVIGSNVSLNIWPPDQLSPVNQVFSLEAKANYDLGINVGFETQYNGPNDLRAKIYYATLLTNLSVIEVGASGVEINVNDFNENFYFNEGFQFNSNSLEVFSISNTGSIFSDLLVGGGTLEADINGNIILGASDQNLKTNINPLTNNLQKVLQLEPVSYTWKDTERFGTGASIGFIAQQVETIIPEVVTQGKEYKSLNYQLLTSVLVGAIQELDLKIENIHSASSTVVSSGFSLNSIRDWLGDVGNGITNLFTKRLTTEEICIVDDQGQTCFNRSQINNLLGETGNNYNGPDSSNNQDAGNEQSPDEEEILGDEGDETSDETDGLNGDSSDEENSSQDDLDSSLDQQETSLEQENSSDNNELPSEDIIE